MKKYIKNKLNEPNTYSQGYVAFLDMMGFQKLCKDESCERIKAIIDDIELFKYKFIVILILSNKLLI